MEKELFNNWSFLYEDSEDISVHIEFYSEGKKDPSLVADISADDFKKIIPQKRAYHTEFNGSFDLTIHAIKDNEVYVSLMMRMSEYSWKREREFVLNKENPCYESEINYFNKKYGSFIIYVKEWKK